MSVQPSSNSRPKLILVLSRGSSSSVAVNSILHIERLGEMGGWCVRTFLVWSVRPTRLSGVVVAARRSQTFVRHVQDMLIDQGTKETATHWLLLAFGSRT